jgi:DNA repair ATPase RecN
MAEVKRYTASIMHPGVREDPEGLLVAYHHYAELKAEVDRLTAFTTRTIIPNEELKAQVEELKDALFKHSGENYHLQIQRERLTKAGDAMADRLMYQGYPETVPAWAEAKGASTHD